MLCFAIRNVTVKVAVWKAEGESWAGTGQVWLPVNRVDTTVAPELSSY